METKKQYTAPAITVVTFKTERGYQASGLRVFNIFSSITPGPQISSNSENWGSTEELFGSGEGWDI